MTGTAELRSGRRAVLAGTFAVYAAASFAGPIAPDIATGIGRPSGDPAFMVVPFAAAFGLCFPAWGRLADRRGTRLPIIASLALTAVAGCALVVVDTSEAMIGLRLLQGAGAAGVPPAAQAYLVRSAPAGQSGRAVGAMMVAVLLGTLASQTIAGLLAAVAGWRVAVLVLAGVLAAVAGTWAAVVLEPSTAEASQAPPPPLRRLLADRRVSSAYVIAALLFGSYWTLLAGLGETLRFERFDLSASVAGLVPMLGLLGVLTTMATGRAVDRFRQRGPMLALAGTGALLAVVASAQQSLAGFVIVVGLFLTVYWALLPIASVQVARHAPPETTATALALVFSALWLGAAAWGLVASVLLDGFTEVALATAASWALAGVAALAFEGRGAGSAGPRNAEPIERGERKIRL